MVGRNGRSALSSPNTTYRRRNSEPRPSFGINASAIVSLTVAGSAMTRYLGSDIFPGAEVKVEGPEQTTAKPPPRALSAIFDRESSG